MCKTKAEGGRCASHLRQQISTAHTHAATAQATAEDAEVAYTTNPSSHQAFLDRNTAREEADTTARHLTQLVSEYDSTRTGQNELTQQVSIAPDEQTRARLTARKDAGHQLRQRYRAGGTKSGQPRPNGKPSTPTKVSARDLKVGDELVYADGNQTITRIDEGVDLNFRRVYDIYVDGVNQPRTHPGSAPVRVLR